MATKKILTDLDLEGKIDATGTVLGSNLSGTNTGDQISSDFNHDDLTGFVADEHIDWTTDQGSTNIHANNYTNTNTFRAIHDTPVDGATTTSISSNWAFDNVKTAVPSGALFTDTNTTYVSSDFNHDDLTGFVADEHIDWTADQGATNIHSGNYTNTNTWNANSKNVAGYVAAPGAVANKVWKTDASGNPAWRDDVDTDSNTFRTVAVDTNGDGSANNTLAAGETLQFKKGSNITLSEAGGVLTISSANDNTTYVSSDFTHDDLTGFVANEHIDWTTDQGSTNIHSGNYSNTQRAIHDTPANGATTTSISSNWAFDNVKTAVPSGALFTDTNTTYVSSDFNHDDLTGFVAKEHLDWTADQGANNIHANNYTDTNTWRGIDDTPVDGATTESISSNWAFDNVKTAVPTGALFTDTNTTYVSSDFNHDDLTGFVAKEHLDWTENQGGNNIHSGNYTNTTYTAGNGLALSGIQFRMAGGSIGGSIDLNTYTSSGYYVQGSNAQATSGSNYPTDNAGILTVVKAEGNNTHITQTYDQYNSSAFYNRSYYDGTWSSWRNLAQDSNTTYSSSDFSHDDLTGFVANEHIDWTIDQGSTNIHANNYTDTNTFRAISSTPTNGASTTSISSDWAFDNVKTAVPSGALFTDTNTTYTSSDFNHDDLTGFEADEHIDWTVDQGATNIHANNYTDTNTFRAISSTPTNGATTTSISSDWAFDNVKTAVPTGALFTDTNTFRAISSTPTNGATSTSISSDWAFDNVKTAVPSGALFTDTNTTYTSSDFTHDNLTGFVANEHIDWTTDQGATNIHANNYTNTNTNQLTTFQVEDGDGTEVTISHGKEWKFVEGQGIDVNWTDTNSGSDADPFDLQFALKANGVRANELNVTGNGTSSQYLRSDGDGSFTWATPSNTVYDETNNVEAENLSTTGGTIPMWVGSATAGDVRILGNSPFQYDNTDAKIVFSGTERFTFASTGAFDADSGITAGGNSTINGNLDINGALDVFSTGGDQFMKMEQGIATVTIGDMDAVSWGSNFKIEGNTGTFKWEQDGTEQMRLTNASVLHVDSDVIAYSTTISDRRLKDDIQTIENASETVKKLRGVSYEWNAGNRKGQKEIGLVAQEVEEVLPFLVREHELPLTKGAIEGELYKTVDYEKLVGLLIEDSKEKDARIERLEAMVEIMLNK
jgi:hypothetical protein